MLDFLKKYKVYFINFFITIFLILSFSFITKVKQDFYNFGFKDGYNKAINDINQELARIQQQKNNNNNFNYKNSV